MKNGTLVDQATKWISAGELVILLITSPLFLFFKPLLAPALLILPLLWLSRRHSRGHFIPRTPVDWPILGLLVMLLIGMWVTPDLDFSVRKIVGLLYGIAVFYATIDWGRRRSSVLLPALVVIGLGFGTALLSLLGTQWPVKLPVLDAIVSQLPKVLREIPDAESGFNPNGVAAILILFIPLQLAVLSGLPSDDSLSKTKRSWLVLGVCLSLVLTSGVVLLAQSRLAWLALVIGVVTMGGITQKWFRPVAIILLVAGIVLVIFWGTIGVGDILAQQGWMANSGEISWVARIERWSRGLWIIADFPLTGTGMDTYRWEAWEMYPFFHPSPGKDLGHAHNIFIQIAMDLGLPGLISYLALLGSTLVLGWHTYRSSSDRLVRMVALGGAVGLGTHAIWTLVDALPLGTKTNFLWWSMAALVVATSLWHGSRTRQAGNKEPSSPQGT